MLYPLTLQGHPALHWKATLDMVFLGVSQSSALLSLRSWWWWGSGKVLPTYFLLWLEGKCLWLNSSPHCEFCWSWSLLWAMTLSPSNSAKVDFFPLFVFLSFPRWRPESSCSDKEVKVGTLSKTSNLILPLNRETLTTWGHYQGCWLVMSWNKQSQCVMKCIYVSMALLPLFLWNWSGTL